MRWRPEPDDGAQRVRLRFLPDGAEVRVPSGTPVFDAASWNGIAIDSTCGGHGTCKKCKVRIVSGDVPVGPLDPAGVHDRRAARRLAAGVPCRRARRPRGRGAAAPDAAEGGARRRRPPRDPAPGGAEAPPRARGADDGGPALGPPAGARRARRPRAPRVDRDAALARPRAAEVRIRRDRGRRRPGADRPRARRHHRRGASRSRSTSGRPRSWRRCSISRPDSRSRCARCSTASSPTAPT